MWDLNPPREEVSDEELTVLVESALNEPFVTAWELDPPTELDWLAKEPEDWVVDSNPPCELLAPCDQPED